MCNRVYKLSQVARYFRVSQSTIRIWCDSGELGCIRLSKGHRRFLLSHLEDYVSQYDYPQELLDNDAIKV
jgi:excisionase family DNA binding protein